MFLFLIKTEINQRIYLYINKFYLYFIFLILIKMLFTNKNILFILQLLNDFQ